jgi:hypothetical protein
MFEHCESCGKELTTDSEDFDGRLCDDCYWEMLDEEEARMEEDEQVFSQMMRLEDDR